VVDFGPIMPEQEAALYEAPFAWVVDNVKPVRINNNRKVRAVYWWRHGEARPGLRAKLEGLSRYIATPETAKHSFFVWFPLSVSPEHSLIVIPRAMMMRPSASSFHAFTPLGLWKRVVEWVKAMTRDIILQSPLKPSLFPKVLILLCVLCGERF